MTRECSGLLSQRIICAVWRNHFKSEAYIDAFLRSKNSVHDDHVITPGGYISGEIKLSITHRLLASEDIIGVAIMFDMYSYQCTKIIYEVLVTWVIHGYWKFGYDKILG